MVTQRWNHRHEPQVHGQLAGLIAPVGAVHQQVRFRALLTQTGQQLKPFRRIMACSGENSNIMAVRACAATWRILVVQAPWDSPMDRRPFLCTRAVGVDFDHGADHRYCFRLDAHDLFPLQVFKYPVEYTDLRPAVHPGVGRHRNSRSEWITPATHSHDRQGKDGVEHLQVRQIGSASLNGNDRRNAFVLRFCNLHAGMITSQHG